MTREHSSPMFLASLRILWVLAISAIVPAHVLAQATPPSRVQPGLEAAVKWKWSVLPSEQSRWGFPASVETPIPNLPQVHTPTQPTPTTPQKTTASIAPGPYAVQRGDALILIARKAGISLSQLKTFNALASDVIRAGDLLQIPTAQELAALAPPIPVATPIPIPKKAKTKSPKPAATPLPDLESETTLLQAFLDRENFSVGPIDGNRGPNFEKICAFYQSLFPDLAKPEALLAKATAAVGSPFTVYRLKQADFRFIAPQKLIPAPKTKGKKPVSQPKSLPPLSYDELRSATFLAYRTPWEFVAERFHCDEAFLRHLNPQLQDFPASDTDFKVPNVPPFEIESWPPRQPAADPDHPIAASIVEFSRLEIRQNGRLVAMMPLSRARPDLRGRGFWTILDVIPAPRMATMQEPTSPAQVAHSNLHIDILSTPGIPASTPKPAPKSTPKPTPKPTPTPMPIPAAPQPGSEQILAAGPRNPVGICWINLAKANSTTPLPYGLHGTSIPSKMASQESIGGLRLTNWDILRAVRLLPVGTPLQWQ